MKRILVTGGAGFIGSHLCRKLLEQGNHVICLDNLFTGRKRNVAELTDKYDEFEFIDHDITQRIEVKADEIYNLACPASPPHYQTDPIKTLRTSVWGTYYLLELTKKREGKFLQASTSEIYGNPLSHPQKENYWGNVNPVGLRSCYDEGKRCAETLVADYHRQYDVDTKIVRIFNTYGENMLPTDGRVISNFIVQALRNENITIYGSGSQTRSFCYVEDLVDGLVKMMESSEHGPINLGNPSERTILDLARLIIEMTDSKSQITFQPLPSDDPVRRQPDIQKAIERLGWRPKTDIKTGLKNTISYFKSELNL